MDADVTVWFNPSCSKCRGARDLLDEKGVSCELGGARNCWHYSTIDS
ncbi:MAG: hypothetical protein H0W70_14015 [Actinobacteria bacterium]|nr:hypothetical protein [Actinomycetota bacterium]